METGKVIADTGVPSLSIFPQPTFHRVIIKEMDDEYVGKILIPESVRSQPSQGKIVAVGPGRRTPEGNRVKMEFIPGQIVVFNRFSGTEIKVKEEIVENGERRSIQNKYVIVPEDEIICVLN